MYVEIWEVKGNENSALNLLTKNKISPACGGIIIRKTITATEGSIGDGRPTPVFFLPY